MAQGGKPSARGDDAFASEGEETSRPPIEEIEWLENNEDAIVGGCAAGFQLVRAAVSSCHAVERMTPLGS